MHSYKPVIKTCLPQPFAGLSTFSSCSVQEVSSYIRGEKKQNMSWSKFSAKQRSQVFGAGGQSHAVLSFLLRRNMDSTHHIHLLICSVSVSLSWVSGARKNV